MKIKDIEKKKWVRISFMKERLKKVVVCLSLAFMMLPVKVSASAGEVTAPLNSLKTLIVSIIGAVGVIILAKNVMEFAQSYQQQDSSSMHSAIKGIVAGLIMASISSVIAFLGL